MVKKIVIAILVVVIAVSGYVVYHALQPVQTYMGMIEENPQAYDGKEVVLDGVIIQYEGAFFGPKFWLVDVVPDFFDLKSAKKIALGSKSHDFSEYTSHTTFDGRNFTSTGQNKTVVVTGTLRYIGEEVTDSPPYSIEVESIESEQQVGDIGEKVIITSINLVEGSQGDQVTITGSGFVVERNDVVLEESGNRFTVYSIPSHDGITLAFAVPSIVSSCPVCADVISVFPGSYILSVENVNGASNGVSFTILKNVEE